MVTRREARPVFLGGSIMMRLKPVDGATGTAIARHGCRHLFTLLYVRQ